MIFAWLPSSCNLKSSEGQIFLSFIVLTKKKKCHPTLTHRDRTTKTNNCTRAQIYTGVMQQWSKKYRQQTEKHLQWQMEVAPVKKAQGNRALQAMKVDRDEGGIIKKVGTFYSWFECSDTTSHTHKCWVKKRGPDWINKQQGTERETTLSSYNTFRTLVCPVTVSFWMWAQ